MGVIGLTITTIGEILIAVAVIRVHSHVIAEHKIDAKVLKQMKFERNFAVLGVILLIVGFIFQVTQI